MKTTPDQSQGRDTGRGGEAASTENDFGGNFGWSRPLGSNPAVGSKTPPPLPLGPGRRRMFLVTPLIFLWYPLLPPSLLSDRGSREESAGQ